ncbi:unnamed protein product, partial [Citrullus colocynthis]
DFPSSGNPIKWKNGTIYPAGLRARPTSHFQLSDFLARLRLLIYGRSGELSLISTRISSMVTAWRVACRSILSKELSFPTIEPNNPVIPLPSTAPSLSTGKLTT